MLENFTVYKRKPARTPMRGAVSFTGIVLYSPLGNLLVLDVVKDVGLWFSTGTKEFALKPLDDENKDEVEPQAVINVRHTKKYTAIHCAGLRDIMPHGRYLLEPEKCKDGYYFFKYVDGKKKEMEEGKYEHKHRD